MHSNFFNNQLNGAIVLFLSDQICATHSVSCDTVGTDGRMFRGEPLVMKENDRYSNKAKYKIIMMM